MSFGIDTWIVIVLNALAVFAAFYFPIRKTHEKKPESSQDENNSNTLILKKRPFFWLISFITILLIGNLAWCLYKNNEPLLVFAGGGSVRNFLLESYSNEKKGEGIDVRKERNSINIAMASGSAWRVLAEEYQFRKLKDRKLNKFITICLSADTISGSFYKEHMAKMDNYIIAAVKLGNDPLVAYISDSLNKHWEIGDSENITSDVLGRKLKKIINTQTIPVDNKPKKVRVFTTNKTSGTLESYKKCLSNYIHFEELLDSAKISIFYDNMEAKNIDTYPTGDGKGDGFREFIILGSEYYTVKDKGKPLYLLDSITHNKVYKQMYLYFLAEGNDNQNIYKIEKRVIKFLKKLEKYNGGIKSAQPDKWDKIMEDGIIYYDKSTYSRYPNIIQIN